MTPLIPLPFILIAGLSFYISSHLHDTLLNNKGKIAQYNTALSCIVDLSFEAFSKPIASGNIFITQQFFYTKDIFHSVELTANCFTIAFFASLTLSVVSALVLIFI